MLEDLSDYFKEYSKVEQCILKRDKLSGRSRGFAFITLEDKDGEIRKKIFSKKHKIKGKDVDVKLAESDKKRMDQLSANKKVFVGGLDPSVDVRKSYKAFLFPYRRFEEIL